MPITDRARIQGTNSRVASGNSGIAKRRIPKEPIFSRIAARNTDPAVGASVWASGSQVWTGNSGTFTANAAKKARNSHRWVPTGRSRPSMPS